MGDITKNATVFPSPHSSKHHKRPREIKDEGDDDSIPLPSRHRHHRRRHSRSRTPSPSPSLGRNDNSPSEDATTSPANLPASLDRHACLRCVKFLASSPDFECKFPARSTKCTRCTRLSSKCEPIPASADAEARHLLSIQAEYELSSPHEAKTLRQSVVAAAEELTVSIRMAAQRRPKTTEETNLALLRGQEEMIGLLRRIEAKLTAQGREEKGKGKGKGRD
ncbi:hypothetical protein V502_10721 [Pseudogymnoascus sp. VKM F-4520 (FW-2644)]|nr:hypothetical protein V502_10721 [Pseudogymnoascus sp. VKM F-4520 (FW-2644)]